LVIEISLYYDARLRKHQIIGFYNRGRECLLSGTDWVFKSIQLRP